MHSQVFVMVVIVFTIYPASGVNSPLKVDLDEISDTFITINITGPSVFEGTKFGSIRVVNQLVIIQQLEDSSKNDQDRNATKVSGKMRKKILTESKQSDYFFQQIQLINLKPDERYLINITGLYGNKSLSVDFIDVTTKSPSVITMDNQPVFLYFDGVDAIDYFVQVSRIKSSSKNQETDCILDIKMSPCFGSKLQLPDLDSGEKFLIKLWYINGMGQKSVVKTIEHYG